jgi:hypothetical protein
MKVGDMVRRVKDAGPRSPPIGSYGILIEIKRNKVSPYRVRFLNWKGDAGDVWRCDEETLVSLSMVSKADIEEYGLLSQLGNQ